MNTIFEPGIDIMEAPYQELFQDLLDRIDQCMQADLTEAERFQNCFWISLKCYRKLKKLILENEFADESEEINFFRNVKPKFTCFIEFFVIASEALWFVENKAECATIFWKEELEKYSRFCRKYYFFIHYYEKGNQEQDHEYFLSATADAISDIHSKMFDDSPSLHSSKDWIVRSYFAHKMYFRFIQDKLVSPGLRNMPCSFSELLVNYMNSKSGYSVN